MVLSQEELFGTVLSQESFGTWLPHSHTQELVGAKHTLEELFDNQVPLHKFFVMVLSLGELSGTVLSQEVFGTWLPHSPTQQIASAKYHGDPTGGEHRPQRRACLVH